MKKEKTVRTYQRRTKSGKMVTVREHKASYDAAEEARKAAAKKAGAGSELSKRKAAVAESPLGFSEADYKEWYHWDMEDDPKNEAALRVEKALTKKMGKKAYNKYLEDMSNSYSARGHKKAHQALLDEHTAQQKKQDAESSKAAKDIARGSKEKAYEAKSSRGKASTAKSAKSATSKAGSVEEKYKSGKKLTDDDLMSWATENNYEGFDGSKKPKMTAKHRKEITNYIHGEVSGNTYYGNGQWENDTLAKDSKVKTSSKSSTTPKKKAKDSDLVEHYDQFNKKSMGKAVGDSFTFSEGRGKDKFTYDARFVTDGRGRYGYVVRDKSEGPDAKYYVGISDGYERHSQLPAGLRKAAEAQGLRFKNGEFVKKETKGDRAVARMNKLVNEALSSTTSDPKALKKQLGALIDYNGGPINRGDKIGKRIDEIREQLGKRSSKKRVNKKSDYDYETSMKNLENYFAEERRKITSKGKTPSAKNAKAEPKTKKPKDSKGSSKKGVTNKDIEDALGWNTKRSKAFNSALKKITDSGIRTTGRIKEELAKAGFDYDTGKRISSTGKSSAKPKTKKSSKK